MKVAYSKEYLVKIIAQMHDTIQEWDNGHGLSSTEAQILIEVGDYCRQYCAINKDWEI